jgi:hypothetical protein
MKTWLRLLLVVLTVGGGFTGLTSTVNAFGAFEKYGLAAEVVGITFMVLYVFIVAAGLLFVHDSHCTRPMLVALALQIPWVSLPVFEYHFAAGLYAAVTLGPPQAAGQLVTYGLTADLGANWQFRFASVLEGPWSVGINLFAVLLYILLRVSIRGTGRSAEPASTLSAE